MAKDVRERMVAGATKLLASKGLQATSFSEVIELTDTPRGSIYHHFPGGKDELVLAALDQSCQLMLDGLEPASGKTAEEVLATIVGGWRNLLTGSDMTTGCAAAAVTVATDTAALLDAAGKVFEAWQTRLAGLFNEGGLDEKQAQDFAALVLATVEGAVVIARAKRSIEAYDQATAPLSKMLQSLR